MLHFILGVLLLLGLSQVGPKLKAIEPISPIRKEALIQPPVSQAIHRWQASLASIGHCMDPVLALKIMKVESNFNNTRAKNESSTGLMQIKPETARWIGCKAQDEHSLLKIELNVACGCRYLGRLGHLYKSIQQVIVSYNAGAPIICKTGRLKNGRPCKIGEYINADYYYKVAKAKL